MILRIQRLAHIAAALSVAAFFSVLTWKTPALLLHVNGVLTRAEGVESKLNATAGNLDKTTKVLADSSKAEAGALIDLTTDAHGTLWQINQTAYAAQKTLATVGDQAKHVGPLLDSLKASSDSIPPVMSDTRNSIAQVGETARRLDGTIDALNAKISDPKVDELMANLRDMTKTSSHMLSTADQVETKFTDPYLHPSHNPFKRAWEQAEPFIVSGAKITSALF